MSIRPCIRFFLLFWMALSGMAARARADPLPPPPPPCTAASQQRPGEVCQECRRPRSDAAACERKHQGDGFTQRCTFPRCRGKTCTEVWCGPAPNKRS